MNIISYGAAEQVTGSCHWVETSGHQFLFDCGMFQGPTKVDQQNLEPLGFDPRELDFVLLSHAHLDHCGRLPLLVKEGFRGSIYTTKATRDLAELILKDSAYLQSHQENPLYTLEDVEKTMTLFSPISQGESFRIGNLDVSYHFAGHLLGASWIKVRSPEGILAFSGDLGRYDSPFYYGPDPLEDVDILLLETTNGARINPSIQQGLQELYDEIKQGFLEERIMLIPCFSIGRTEEILAGLSQLAWSKKDDQFKSIPFFVDSALSQAGLKVYQEHADFHKINPKDLSPENLHLISREESFALDKNKDPKVFLSASGMMEGGHILHHAQHYLPDPRTLLFFVGYQGEETLGRKILEGESTVLINKSPVHISAEIKEIKGLSGHGDQKDLLRFLSTADRLKQLVLIHGVPETMLILKELLPKDLKVVLAQQGIQSVDSAHEA